MNYIFPNEVHTVWTALIVLYPFITGLATGTHILSSLFYVFGREPLRPVGRFALVASFGFLLFACVPLLLHLGQPARALKIMVTPNFTSAMAGFGYIYALVLLVVGLQLWFVLRSDLIARGQGSGPIAWLCRTVTFGNRTDTDATRRADQAIATFLAGLGVPSALLLGYVGFLFGSVKANAWWSTPLMLPTFIFSGIVSGFAFTLVGYYVVSWIKRTAVDKPCVKSLRRFLWGFMMVAVALEILDVAFVAYERADEWDIISRLLSDKLALSFVVLQLLIFSLVPFLLLGAASLLRLSQGVARGFTFCSALLLLGQVGLMRYNVIVGGQYLSKSLRGFRPYEVEILGREGLLTTGLVFLMPLLVIVAISRIIPLFPVEGPKSGRHASEHGGLEVGVSTSGS